MLVVKQYQIINSNIIEVVGVASWFLMLFFFMAFVNIDHWMNI